MPRFLFEQLTEIKHKNPRKHMKKAIISAILILIVSGFSFAQDQNINSQIKEVTVFLQGAQVQRQAQAQIPTGISRLIFTDLPLDINPQSIQIKGSGNFTVLSVNHQVNFLKAQEKSKEVKNLEDSIRYYKDKMDMENVFLKVVNEEESLMMANKNLGGTETGLKVAELKEAADFYKTRLTDIKTRQLNHSRKIKEMQEKHDRILNQIRQLQGIEKQPQSEIVVTVSASSATRAELSLSYIGMNAGWSPIYDIRATNVTQPIDFVFKANVLQSTGEDWNNVKLTLSTGNPMLGGQMPYLATWWLDFYAPEIAEKLFSRQTPAPMMAKEEMTIVIDEVEMDYETVSSTGASFTQVSSNQTTMDYVISIPYNIPSGNNPQAVEIQKYQMPAQFEYYCMPKIDRDAFLVARISGWEQYNFLPGQANLFFEGTYLGESFIDAASTSDTLDVSMGRDKGIVVSRDKRKDFSSRKTIGSKQSETIAWEINIRNNKRQNIKLNIIDQVPVSMQKDIEITADEISGAKLNEETGELKWALDLKASENKKLLLSYTVKYPKSKKVILE